MKSTAQSLVEHVPFRILGPTTIIRVAFALVLDTVDFLGLTDPFGTERVIDC
jgi:hypothetical protein